MIRHLPKEVQGKLRAGVALTSLAQCVEELVLNAVDAGTTCVAVRVDLQSLTVQVVDNGAGIPLSQLPMVGERYMTSKCHSVNDLDNLRYFGYRGEALSSLRCMSSVMEIVTRPKHSTTTYSRCFHKGKALPVCEATTPRPGTGTTVTVHDLFYNLPVRRKKLNKGIELERIRFRLAAVALIWPQISFSLRDDVTGNVILQTHKSSGTLATFSSLFGGVRAKTLREVKAENETLKISGYISRETYSRRDLQFVFVNRRLVLKSKIHKVLDTALGRAGLVRQRIYLPEKAERSAAEKTEDEEAGDKTSGEAVSPTRMFERYAVYVVNIKCPLSVYDITFDPAKTLVEFHNWSELNSLVEEMVLQFLKDENLSPPNDLLQTRPQPQEFARDIHPQISSSNTPDCVPESEDPFQGNDEEYDEQVLSDQRRRRYAQGISTYNSCNNLFSHTVRRPRDFQFRGDGVVPGPSVAKKPKKANEDETLESTGLTCQLPGIQDYDAMSENNVEPGARISGLDGQSKSAEADCSMLDTPVAGESAAVAGGKKTLVFQSPVKTKQSSVTSREQTAVTVCIQENGEMMLKQFMYDKKSVLHYVQKKESVSKIPSNHAVSEIRLPESFSVSCSLHHLRSVPANVTETASATCWKTDTFSKLKAASKFENATAQTESNGLPEAKVHDTINATVLPPLKRPVLYKSKSVDLQCLEVKNMLHSPDPAVASFYDSRQQFCARDDIGVRYSPHDNVGVTYSPHDDVGMRCSPCHCQKHLSAKRLDMVKEGNSTSVTGTGGMVSFQRQSVDKLNNSCFRLGCVTASPRSESFQEAASTCRAWRPFTTLSQTPGDDHECHAKKTGSVCPAQGTKMSGKDRCPSLHFKKQGSRTHAAKLARIAKGQKGLQNNVDSMVADGLQHTCVQQVAFCEADNQRQSASRTLSQNDCRSASTGDFQRRMCLTELVGIDIVACCSRSSEIPELASLANPADVENTALLQTPRTVFAKEKPHMNSKPDSSDGSGEPRMATSHAVFMGCPSRVKESMETQGCPILSSQGFTPQLSNISQGFNMTSQLRSSSPDSHLSIHSTGFSPAAEEPMTCSSQVMPLLTGVSASCTDSLFSPATVGSHEFINALPTENILLTGVSASCTDSLVSPATVGSHEFINALPTENNGTESRKAGLCPVGHASHDEYRFLLSSAVACEKKTKSHETTGTENFDAQKQKQDGLFKDNSLWSGIMPPEPDDDLLMHPSNVVASCSLGKPAADEERGENAPVADCEHGLEDWQVICSPEANTDFHDSLTDSVLGLIHVSGSQILNTPSQSYLTENTHHTQDPLSVQSSSNSISAVLNASTIHLGEVCDILCTSRQESCSDTIGRTDEMTQHAASMKPDSVAFKDPEFLLPASRDPHTISSKLSQEWSKSRIQKMSGILGEGFAMTADSYEVFSAQSSSKRTGKDFQDKTCEQAVHWVSLTDPATGNLVYINSNSGHSMTETQYFKKGMDQNHASAHVNEITEKASSQCCKESQATEQLSPLSHQTLRALFDESFEEDAEESLSKWRDNGQTHAYGDSGTGLSTEDILSTWENPVFHMPEKVLQVAEQKHASRASRLAHCLLQPTSFDKTMLMTAKVLGQVDNKFVACLIQEDMPKSSALKTTGLLVLFDQHAAHERIRLEQLIADVYEKDPCGEDSRIIRRSDVDPPRQITLSENDVRVMQSFRKEFERIGILFEVDKDRRDTVHVLTVPACVGQREANDRKRGKDPLRYGYVETMICEHTQLLLSTEGATYLLPRSVHRLMATHACKGAIKFGDKLSLETCGDLVRGLASCDLPFQCAHGRPSLAPLISLSQLQLVSPDQKQKPRLWRLHQVMQKAKEIS